jgi:hypothetical protein
MDKNIGGLDGRARDEIVKMSILIAVRDVLAPN